MSIRVATLILRSVAKDPPLTEKPEMLQMSLLRLVFMGLQEADSKQIFSALFRTPSLYQDGYASELALIQTDFRAVPKPRPEDARFARTPKQSTTPIETRNWIVLAGSTATRGTRTQSTGCLIGGKVLQLKP